jgi:protoporphyrinogen/coproporphyrinogen III oxidase
VRNRSGKRVVVIGAGIAGLYAAHELRKRGISVQVFEAAAAVGGRIRTIHYRGDRIDGGAQFYHQDYHRALRQCEEFGIRGSIRPATGTARYSLLDGPPYTHDLRSAWFAPLGLAGHLDLAAFLIRYVLFGRRFPAYDISRRIEAYDKVCIARAFETDKHFRFRRFVVDPISFLSNMGSPEWLNLYHFLHQFKFARFANNAVCDLGMTALPEKLASAGPPVVHETPVARIVRSKERIVGVELATTHQVVDADHVIIAVPSSHVSRLIADELPSEAAFFSEVIYSPAILPILFLDRPLPADALFYINDPRREPTFLCGLDHRVKAPTLVPSGRSALSCWAGHPKTLELASSPDAVVIDRAINDLSESLPGLRGWVEHAVVSRHGFGVERYPTGSYGRIIDFVDRAKRINGVSFAGSLFGGSGIEGAILSAHRAADRAEADC